jgi:hypothetical protein
MKEINIDGEIWIVNLEKAKEQGLLSLKKERPKYHVGQRFVYQFDELTTEEYILAETGKYYGSSYVNLISLDDGIVFACEPLLILDINDITEKELEELLGGNDCMKPKE